MERLDRVDRSESRTVWRCDLRREVPWDAVLARALPSWTQRITTVERRLRRLRPFRRSLRIVILEHRPWAFRLTGDTLFVGARLVEADGHLERGIAKAWLRDGGLRRPGDDLLEDVFTDLALGASTGVLKIEDPIRGLRVRVEARWPHVLKGADDYCASPWKLSEHFEACEKDASSFRNGVWRLGLRPFLTSVALTTWRELPLSHRFEVLRQLPRWTSEAMPELRSRGSAAAVDTIRWFRESISKRRDRNGFSAAFSRNLGEAGFSETDARVSLDVLLLVDFDVGVASSLHRQLKEFAIARPKMTVALKDSNGLRIYPSGNLVPIDDLSGVRVARLAVLRCGPFDFDWVLSFENVARKLFVVDACRSKSPDLRAWLHDGPEGFAIADKDLAFVQFDLPSLASRRAFFESRTDVLMAIAKPHVADPIFRAFGWEDPNWSKTANFYQPRALIDGIEFFRPH